DLKLAENNTHAFHQSVTDVATHIRTMSAPHFEGATTEQLFQKDCIINAMAGGITVGLFNKQADSSFQLSREFLQQSSGTAEAIRDCTTQYPVTLTDLQKDGMNASYVHVAKGFGYQF